MIGLGFEAGMDGWMYVWILVFSTHGLVIGVRVAVTLYVVGL